jgi:hypothetical protein
MPCACAESKAACRNMVRLVLVRLQRPRVLCVAVCCVVGHCRKGQCGQLCVFYRMYQDVGTCMLFCWFNSASHISLSCYCCIDSVFNVFSITQAISMCCFFISALPLQCLLFFQFCMSVPAIKSLPGLSMHRIKSVYQRMARSAQRAAFLQRLQSLVGCVRI